MTSLSTNPVTLFLSGAVSMGFAIAGLFFMRFWKKAHDRLFLIFGLAFWTMSIEHVVLLVLGDGNFEINQPLFYLFRLAAFALILLGIVDKNRRS
jgi:hypothetical protein